MLIIASQKKTSGTMDVGHIMGVEHIVVEGSGFVFNQSYHYLFCKGV